MRHIGALLVIFIFVAPAYAEDTSSSRKVAAVKYLKTVNVGEMLDQTAVALAPKLPVDVRDKFVSAMRTVDSSALEREMLEALINHFTTEELEKLAEFYGSSIGQSIYKKFPQYTAATQPIVMRHTMGVLKNLAPK